MESLPVAECPSCAWRARPQGIDPDEVVRVAVELEEHLAREHDLSWARSREIASGWLGWASASLRQKAS